MRSDLPGRVLMTVDAVGGVWRYAMDLAAGLKARNIGVVFAGLGPEPSGEQVLEARRLGTLHWLPAPLDWMAENENELDGLAPCLAGLVQAEAIDLLHLNLPSQACGLGAACPVVAVSHSCVVTWFRAVRNADCPADWAWQKRRNRCGFDRADAVVAPSGSHARLLEACYGPIPELSVAFNASPPASLQPAPERPFVFAAGRWWDEGKNGGVLDAAAQRCAWPVRVAGPVRGPNGQAFAFRNAEPLGNLPFAAVEALMAEAGIFCSPSVYEPFGLAALEAAKAGTPLLLADIPTYRELWDGAALFADPHRPEAFAEWFDRLAQDAALRGEMGRLARERAERFSLESQAEAMARIYAAARTAFRGKASPVTGRPLFR